MDVKIMGLDVGDRRIGVAVSDPSGTLASAITVVERKNIERDIKQLLALAEGNDVAAIVVGLPYRLDGTLGEQAEKVQRFAKHLQRHTQLPLSYWDERLTTSAARQLMIEAGMKRSRRKSSIDAAAAALILQGYLDHHCNGNAAGGDRPQ